MGMSWGYNEYKCSCYFHVNDNEDIMGIQKKCFSPLNHRDFSWMIHGDTQIYIYIGTTKRIIVDEG